MMKWRCIRTLTSTSYIMVILTSRMSELSVKLFHLPSLNHQIYYMLVLWIISLNFRYRIREFEYFNFILYQLKLPKLVMLRKPLKMIYSDWCLHPIRSNFNVIYIILKKMYTCSDLNKKETPKSKETRLFLVDAVSNYWENVKKLWIPRISRSSLKLI